MRTTSAWGTPPRRFMRLITRLERSSLSRLQTCIVGCSDGKFVLPLARRGHSVVGYDIDPIALYGGWKDFPIVKEPTPAVVYSGRDTPLKSYDKESRNIAGLYSRLNAEGFLERCKVIETDFYRSRQVEKFDFVFTSCSIQYKSNRDLDVRDMVKSLQDAVRHGGALAMDYMLPLEDSHDDKAPHFFRTGQLRKLFPTDQWRVDYYTEAKIPVFENAHVDRCADHFHKFGYLVARKVAP